VPAAESKRSLRDERDEKKAELRFPGLSDRWSHLGAMMRRQRVHLSSVEWLICMRPGPEDVSVDVFLVLIVAESGLT